LVKRGKLITFCLQFPQNLFGVLSWFNRNSVSIKVTENSYIKKMRAIETDIKNKNFQDGTTIDLKLGNKHYGQRFEFLSSQDPITQKLVNTVSVGNEGSPNMEIAAFYVKLILPNGEKKEFWIKSTSNNPDHVKFEDTIRAFQKAGFPPSETEAKKQRLDY